MHLDDVWCEVGGKWWNARALVVRHGDDDVLRLEALGAGHDEESGVLPRKALHAHARAHRQRERPRIGFQKIRHLVFRGK